jgi:hypothetical protein
LILGTSDFSPRHGALPRIFANPKESQPAEITHCFFSQALRMRVFGWFFLGWCFSPSRASISVLLIPHGEERGGAARLEPLGRGAGIFLGLTFGYIAGKHVAGETRGEIALKAKVLTLVVLLGYRRCRIDTPRS